MNSSYRLKKDIKKNLHVTRVHGAQIPKRHYMSLKRHYRAPEFLFLFLTRF